MTTDPNPLAAFLATDPRDAGCEQTWAMIGVYAELVRSGDDPEASLPGITAHLVSCGPCEHDFQGLLSLLRSTILDG